MWLPIVNHNTIQSANHSNELRPYWRREVTTA